jgi:E3 ubiquitin-protein ligase CBL
MSQNNSFKSNVINRLLDINRNISDTILENNLQQSISNALTAVSSTFKSNSFIMDVIANSSSNQMMTEQTSIFNSILHNPIKVEKKLFDRLNKLAEKVLKYCQCEKLKLINSPPYIIDIIPDICFILNAIQTSYENKMHVLNDIEYFNILSRNLLDKLNKIAELFKFSGKRIYDETSDERVRLTKYTLILSHMLAEMRSMFPNNVYEGQSFRIAKTDAADFWRQNFKEKAIISWEDFEKKLNNVHKITHKMESFKLRSTIQLTESNYVSIFEFDIFTR